MFFRRKKRFKTRRKSIPFLGKGTWGTVYLISSLDEPDLFKVGYTTRPTKQRKSELKKVGGNNLKIVFTIQMKHAYFTEQHVLKKLRSRFLGKGDKRGTEWFRLRKNETFKDIANQIINSSRTISNIAKFKFSWSGEIKLFDPLLLIPESQKEN